MKKIILIIIATILLNGCFSYGDEIDEGENDKIIDEVQTDSLEDYIKNNNSYLNDKNIDIKEIIKNAMEGRLDISLKDYILYEVNQEKGYFSTLIKSCFNIIFICLLLTIIKYFSEEMNNQNVSEIVVFFTAIIIFSIILKDVNNLKEILKNDFTKFETITRDVNGLFMAALLTFGKLSILQFFQTYLNYVIGISTKFIYSFTDIVTIIMIAVILINNSSKVLNAKLFYSFFKKGVLLILSAFIIIVVINFSVQGYILYKTDNIFISSIKALSPSSIPFVGSAVGSFFGVFLKSILMIKDILGIVVIIFIISLFGGSLIKIFTAFILYKIISVIVEPINENVSKLIFEMSDIFYIYLICLATPIIIITVYYSVLLNYMNNIFG